MYKLLFTILIINIAVPAFAQATQPPKPNIRVSVEQIQPAVSEPKIEIKKHLERELDYEKIRQNVENSYSEIDKGTWNKYFKKQTKMLKKVWSKEDILTNHKYKTSYARILVYVNSDGNIKNYDIKSSCVPKGDTEFITKVETIMNKVKFEKIPDGYKNNILVFTIKFHANLSQTININNIDWNRYGIADIEAGNQNAKFYIKE